MYLVPEQLAGLAVLEQSPGSEHDTHVYDTNRHSHAHINKKGDRWIDTYNDCFFSFTWSLSSGLTLTRTHR